MAGQNSEIFKSSLADPTTQWTVGISALYARHLIDWRLMTLAMVQSTKEVSVVLGVVMVQVVDASKYHAAEVTQVPGAEKVGVDIILAAFNIFDTKFRVYFLK